METDTSVVVEMAERLRHAEQNLTPCEPIRDALVPGDIEAAYAIQRYNTDAKELEGRRAIGRKIGLTAKSVQKQLGIDQPDFGIVFADMVVRQDELIDFESLMQPRIEAELALVLEKDLTMERPIPSDVMSAIAYVVPAFEILSSRIRGWDINIQDTIADNASAALIVLGATKKKIDEIDLELCGMQMTDGFGRELCTGIGACCLGNPINAASWLAEKMYSVGKPLLAGDVIMSGSLGPFIDVQRGSYIQARVQNMGTVTARFSD